jgi:hypothetical protein
MERQVASKLLARFEELGVFGWESGPRGSHTPGVLTLPSGGHSDTVRPAAQGVTVAPLHSNALLSKESSSVGVSIDAGEQHSTLSGLHDNRVESTGAGKPSREALQGMPEEELLRVAWREPEMGPAIQAERKRRAQARPLPEVTNERTRAVFGLDNEHGFHGDERTGDGIGDDEASLVRHRNANPLKTAARRRRER